MVPLPHITRRQLVLSLILALTSIIFLLVSLVLQPSDSSSQPTPLSSGSRFDPWGVKDSAAQGIRWVVVEKVRANFGFGSGYIPVDERPLAEDESGAGLFDSDGGVGSDPSSPLSPSSSGLGLTHGWNTVKNKSSSVWNTLGSKLSSLTSSSTSQRPRVTDWDDLPFENKAFKEWEYTRGLIYEGTGARVQRFLEKARSGRGFVVAVVGGSVSKGRGLPKLPFDVEVGRYVIGGSESPSSHVESGSTSTSSTTSKEEGNDAKTHHHHQDHPNKHKRLHSSSFPEDRDPAKTQNLYNPFNMHMQVFEYLNERFPAMPLEYGYSRKARRAEEASTPIANLTSGVEPGHEHHSHNRGSNQFINGAQGGIGSDYFAGCWKEHLGEDVDLVIVELGINDARSLEAMENYELLLRSLLEMGSRPAVINVQ
jgi:hypothetical protein